MDSVTIIVATYGDPTWKTKAATVAIPSAHPQATVVAVHDSTIAEARNVGAVHAKSKWLIFLDADDELADGYVEAMLAADGDLRAPELHLIRPDGDVEVPDLVGRDITTVNPCCIGTMIRRSRFLDVGGFWAERGWEDWSLFRRCWLAGDRIVHVPDAVYRSFQDPAGRNSTIDQPGQLHREIIRSHRLWLQGRAA